MTSPLQVPAPAEGRPAGVEYHRALAGKQRRIGRGLLAIALLVAGLLVFAYAFSWLGGLLEEAVTGPGSTDASAGLSPLRLAAGMTGAALLIPWSMLIQRWLYGVSGSSLHSVASRLRLGIWARAALLVVPLYALALAVHEVWTPHATVTWARADVVGMVLVAVIMAPLQSAGEEYGVRGLVFRVAASWAHARAASLLVGIGVSSAVFAVIHVAADPWWNVAYVLVSVTAAFATWRTGGLEVAIVLHATYNAFTLLYWTALHADLTERLDRSAGSMTAPLFLATSLALVITGGAVWLRTRRQGPVCSTVVSDVPAAAAFTRP